MRIVLQPDARDDLRDIWRFGAERWSVVLADAYFDLLTDAIERLGENPGSGPVVDALPYRRLVAGSHSIFYRTEADTVLVVRVLHQSEDASRHLDRSKTPD